MNYTNYIFPKFLLVPTSDVISFFEDFDLLVKSDFSLSFIVELIIELYYILYEMNLLP